MKEDKRDEYGEGEKTVKLMGQEIVGKKVDPDTRGIRTFVLADGENVDYGQALEEIHAGNSKGLIVQGGRFGSIIRTSPDGDGDNNLDSLPTVND